MSNTLTNSRWIQVHFGTTNRISFPTVQYPMYAIETKDKDLIGTR